MARPEWQFFLMDTFSFEEIGELRRCRSRQGQRTLNGSGSLSMEVPTNLKVSREIQTIKTSVLARRNGIDMWSGFITTTVDQLPGTHVNINAVGWRELLNYRVLRDTQTGGGTLTYTNKFPYEIIYGLLQLANDQLPTLITTGNWNGGSNYPNVTPTQITKSYEKDINIGSEINTIIDLENGPDVDIDPFTRQLNIYAKKGAIREDVLYGYGVIPHNLASVVRNEDGTKTMNRMTARGKFDNALAEDVVSQSVYGLFEEVATLSDVVDVDTLLGFAGAEVALRAQPWVTYSVQPKITTGKGIQPFDDFDVGDTIFFSSRGGRISVDNQAMRIFGFPWSLTDTGAEQIGQLQITAEGS